MKTLVVFYSFSGNTRQMATVMAEAIGADLLELKPAHEVPPKGLKRYVWASKACLMKDRPALSPLDRDPRDYDLVLVGTPVWAWTYAPPLRSFLQAQPLGGKAVALFCCHGGNPGKVFAKMRDALPGSRILGESDFREPLKHAPEECAGRAREWAAAMLKAATPPA